MRLSTTLSLASIGIAVFLTRKAKATIPLGPYTVGTCSTAQLSAGYVQTAGNPFLGQSAYCETSLLSLGAGTTSGACSPSQTAAGGFTVSSLIGTSCDSPCTVAQITAGYVRSGVGCYLKSVTNFATATLGACAASLTGGLTFVGPNGFLECINVCTASQVNMGYSTSLQASVAVCTCSRPAGCTAASPASRLRSRSQLVIDSAVKGHAFRPASSEPQRQRVSPMCPADETACPLASFGSGSGGYECLDLKQELTACGACDRDCSRLPGVANVGCHDGQCRVFSCRSSFRLRASDNVCVFKRRAYKVKPIVLTKRGMAT